ncbi:MAG: PorT family protein [Saprospiraceae bacterium]|nr:PorT family protein [Saprospiraceae bacterium]
MKLIQCCKLLALAAVFFLSLPAAQAQMPDGRTRFGLKAGLSAANFTQQDFEGRKGRVGFVGGAFAKIPLGPPKRISASLRPEVLFTMKGATVTPDSLSDVSFKLNYVEVPLSLDLNLFAFLNLHGGVQAGTLISSVDKNFDVNKLDYGWHLGAGFDIGNIGLHARYNSSFNNLFDVPALDGTRNWNLTVSASFSIN